MCLSSAATPRASSVPTRCPTAEPRITLLVGLGVEGDAHAGTTVKHRSRVKLDPSQAHQP